MPKSTPKRWNELTKLEKDEILEEYCSEYEGPYTWVNTILWERCVTLPGWMGNVIDE